MGREALKTSGDLNGTSQGNVGCKRSKSSLSNRSDPLGRSQDPPASRKQGLRAFQYVVDVRRSMAITVTSFNLSEMAKMIRQEPTRRR